MASEKVAQILKSKSPFTAKEIEAMQDSDGWAWIYANAESKKKNLPQVCFTGFGTNEKAELTDIAVAANLEVVGSVTKKLAILCVGAYPGAAKIEKALTQKTTILNRIDFEQLLRSSEAPK